MIYADHAATTKLDEEAFEFIKKHLMDDYGNASQPYSFSRKNKKILNEARKIIAECINAEPSEIYFTSGGTESNNWAIKGTSLLRPESSVITSAIEHHSIINAKEFLNRVNKDLILIPVNEFGVVYKESLKEYLSNNEALLVSIMFANNEIGTIQDIKELAQIAHDHDTIFHTDAVQAVGHIPIDVKKLEIDMLSASAHKFNGPKGIGFLYIKEGIEILNLIDGGAQEAGKRAGTENPIYAYAMAIALKNSCNRIESTVVHLKELESVLLQELEEQDVDFKKNGSYNKVPGNLSLSFRNINGETLLHRLDLMRIYVSTGSACNGNETEVSNVIKAIDVDDNYAYGTIRISLGYENTREEAISIAKSIAKIIKTI